MSKKKQTKENLKPCPFCGGDPDIELYGVSGYFVECPDCPCSLGWYPTKGIFKTEWLARTAWNTRVSDE